MTVLVCYAQRASLLSGSIAVSCAAAAYHAQFMILNCMMLLDLVP